MPIASGGGMISEKCWRSASCVNCWESVHADLMLRRTVLGFSRRSVFTEGNGKMRSRILTARR
jgi:hypothetical protein